MARQSYSDPVLQKVIDLLSSKMTKGYVKTWYQGDVLLVPRSELPAVSVAIDQNNIMADSSLWDASKIPITLSILVDHTDQAGLKSWDLSAGQMTLYEITAGRIVAPKDQGETLDFLDGCMAAILLDRKNQDLGNGVYLNIENNTFGFDYGIGVERRGAGIFSVEATCRLTLTVDTPAINGVGVSQ